jgi:hypothetical protein
MKKIIVTVSTLLIVGFIGSSAFAWGCGGYDRGYNRTGYHNTDSYQAFYKDTQELRSSIAADQAELNALMAGTNPDPKRARELSLKISKSENELRAKAQEYNISDRGPRMMGYGNGWNCWND